MAWMLLALVSGLRGLSAASVNSKKNACSPPQWTYSDFTQWNSLPGSFCGDTDDQSPVDIQDTTITNVARFDVQPTFSERVTFVRNAHTWQVNFMNPENSAHVTDDKTHMTYSIRQFHFHAPSEHTINGKHYDMELHLVHMNQKTGYHLVVAYFLQQGGNPNQWLESIWGRFPTAEGESDVELMDDPFTGLLTSDASYYTYEGSFTTPPCTLDTTWVIYKKPIEISAEQLERFRKGINAPATSECSQLASGKSVPAGLDKTWDTKLGTNNRPTQPLAGRRIDLYEGRKKENVIYS